MRTFEAGWAHSIAFDSFGIESLFAAPHGQRVGLDYFLWCATQPPSVRRLE